MFCTPASACLCPFLEPAKKKIPYAPMAVQGIEVVDFVTCPIYLFIWVGRVWGLKLNEKQKDNNALIDKSIPWELY